MRHIAQLARRAVKAPVRAALDLVPLGVWQNLFPKDVVGVMYHVVSDASLAHIRYYDYKNTRQFTADVAYARERQRTIRYGDVVRFRLGGGGQRPNGVLFTFDDGLAECFSVAMPILLAHEVDAVFFVTGDFVDSRRVLFELKVSLCLSAIEHLSSAEAADVVGWLGMGDMASHAHRDIDSALLRYRLQSLRMGVPATANQRALVLELLRYDEGDAEQIDRMCERLGVDPARSFRERPPYMTAEQVRELANAGFTVGGHGIAHVRMQGMSADAVEREVVTSCERIRELSGQKKVPFAFPYSGDGIDRTLLADLLRRYDFVELFFDTGGMHTDAPFVVNRVGADDPAGCVGDGTNLPRLLRREWSRRTAWSRAQWETAADGHDRTP